METTEEQKKPRLNPLVGGGVALVVGLLGTNIYFSTKSGSLERELKDLRTAVKAELVGLREETRLAKSEREKAIAELQQQIASSESKSQEAALQATVASRKYSEQLARQTAEQQQKHLRASHEELTKLSAQLGEVKAAASQINEKVGGIATDVTNARTEIASARSDVSKTFNELRSVRGDMGIQSGKIATNARELAALKALGDRAYFEFELPKTKTPQRIGDVSLQLKKWDVKRNRFTIDLIADDRRTEKKDRTVNEPVQFYVAKARVPYEIVVNEVRRDKIVGYLAAPKTREPRY